MAEALNSLFKAECIRNPVMRPRGWKSVSDVEIAVAEYVDWFNHRRRHGEIGRPARRVRGQPLGPDQARELTSDTRPDRGWFQVTEPPRDPGRSDRPAGPPRPSPHLRHRTPPPSAAAHRDRDRPDPRRHRPDLAHRSPRRSPDPAGLRLRPARLRACRPHPWRRRGEARRHPGHRPEVQGRPGRTWPGRRRRPRHPVRHRPRRRPQRPAHDPGTPSRGVVHPPLGQPGQPTSPRNHVGARMLRARAEAAGLDGTRITAHSLRAGHATQLPSQASRSIGSPPRPDTRTSPSSSTARSAHGRRSRRPPAETWAVSQL